VPLPVGYVFGTMMRTGGEYGTQRSVGGTMMRSDLNDFAYFAEVVGHGGFAAAARMLREPKSKLSRRIAGLEARLGLRLIERSSRRFRVTEVGQAFYERCRAILAEAEQAEALVTQAQAEPHGRIRFSCPTGMVMEVSGLMTSFLARYPKVRLQLVAIDRPVDLIEERIDVALRVRSVLASDAALTMRSLGKSTRILVACPQLAGRLRTLDDLAMLPTLAASDEEAPAEWHLETDDGQAHMLRHEPRMGCGDFAAVREAAVAGLGVALLPNHLCRDALAQGRLVHVLSEWRGHRGIVHLVFTTPRGLPRAVRAFIDHLAAGFSKTWTSKVPVSQRRDRLAAASMRLRVSSLSTARSPMRISLASAKVLDMNRSVLSLLLLCLSTLGFLD
jgi:DNA-binding transcriptional LysR family regulator